MVEKSAALKPPAKYSIRNWQLWTNSPGVIALILGVEAVALLGTLRALPGTSLNSSEIWRAIVIVVACIAYEECSRRMQALRFRFGAAHYTDMTSVWMIAAAIALQPFVAVLTVVAFRTGLWLIYQRKIGMKFYRALFTTATMVCACLAVSFVLDSFGLGLQTVPSDFGAAVAVISAILVFTLVNRALVVAVVAMATKTFSKSSLVGSWEDNAVEFATLSLGGITAVLLLYHPWLVVLVVAPMAALQRSVLVKEFQEAAMIDSKTGLLNAISWQQLSIRELARSKREESPAALLMLDLDHFKAVNDKYGHLAGDGVLRTVADALKAELRDYDAVGRFGGEEFVVLLPDTDTARSIVVAQRLREAVSEATTGHRDLGGSPKPLTVSIGIATFPDHGLELDDLMRNADSALYRAKHMGRDRVVLWSPDAGLDLEVRENA